MNTSNYSNFADPRARHDAPHTSRNAARSAKRSAPTWRTRLLTLFEHAGASGLTADEACERLNAMAQCVGPRVSDLAGAGAITATGTTRPTRTGSRARVFVLARFAPEGGGG